MRKLILMCSWLICFFDIAFSQSKIDTLYYDKDWKGCEQTFAAYRRVYSIPSDSNLTKRFRDYYITGELRADGEYVSIDKYDDSKSVFNGAFVYYYKSGKVERKGYTNRGKLDGEYTQYNEDGLISSHIHYKDGKYHGIYTRFTENGLCIQTEYANGKPLYDYCVISNNDGYCSKVSLYDMQPIYDSPLLDEIRTEYQDGVAWKYCNKNGIIIGMTIDEVRDYGKYYQTFIVIANNSMYAIEFEPEYITAMLNTYKNEEWELIVYSADDYMRKVRRRQNWDMALYAFSESLAAADAGYSTSTTTSAYSGASNSSANASVFGSDGYAIGNYSGNSAYYGTSSSTITSYDANAAYRAKVIANDRVASYSNSLLSERAVKEEGYLKHTTIYPGETISGYINIERKKGSSLNIEIYINGAIYTFPWIIE